MGIVYMYLVPRATAWMANPHSRGGAPARLAGPPPMWLVYERIKPMNIVVTWANINQRRQSPHTFKGWRPFYVMERSPTILFTMKKKKKKRL